MAAKVLVTGASGLLGRAIYHRLDVSGAYKLLGIALSRDRGGLFKLVDLCDHRTTNDVIMAFKPDVIIHCAAERRPDVMEKQEEKCRQLNITATSNIAKIAKEIGAWMLYIGSDYVFDGKEPPFPEDNSRTNPLNKYGRSKLEGEIECLSVSDQNAVLRVPVLYGKVERLDESAVTILFQHVLKTDTKCIMSDYERRYPTYVDDIAVVIEQMIEKRSEIHGIFHWSGKEEMTKYDMAVTMAKLFGLPQDHIVADKTPSTGASRPYNAKLDCKKLPALGIGKFTDFETGIKECLEPWAKENKVKVKIHVD